MENKPLFFISCPIDTYSGYGARSRDLVRAIIQLDKYDVKILPQMWGNTPWGFIEENPEWEFLNKHIWNQPQLPKQPEMWLMSLNGENKYCNPSVENIAKEVFLAMMVLFQPYKNLKIHKVTPVISPRYSVPNRFPIPP